MPAPTFAPRVCNQATRLHREQLDAGLSRFKVLGFHPASSTRAARYVLAQAGDEAGVRALMAAEGLTDLCVKKLPD